MSKSLRYATVSTGLGWVGILSSNDGLSRITLPQATKDVARRRLGEEATQAEEAPYYFRELEERFQRYFNGEKVGFPDLLDLSRATPFQRMVWEATRLIPYGETRSYGWVAQKLKKPGAARAVGQALSQNPLPIIVPCHRVLQSDGELGGFTGGLEIKQRLLALEGKEN